MEEAKTTYKYFLQPRDAWDTLSMKEKAKMIGVAVRNGITNLQDIREKYNEFAEGGNIYDGESQSSNQMVTTGGTGHIPDNYGQGSIDAIRRRLYRNITPFGYHNPISRTLGAIVLNRQDDTRSKENKRIKDSDPDASALDALWATYLNIPENQRRNINSKYGISKTKDGYYRFNNPGMIFNFEQDLSPNGLFRLPGRKAIMMSGILGNYTTGLGRDTRGDYIFYSDSRLNPDGTPNIKTGWDINPYSNTVDNATEETTKEHGQYGQDKKDLSYKIGKALFENVEDISMGIGTPVPIYDKVYLDDIYDVQGKERGGHYIPEITVYGSKHSLGGPLVEAAMNEYKKGGSIHIKKENRGKFTRLKERTGHSATWFKQHGTPAQKKMATFALNARKWKHGLGGNLFDGTTQPTQKMSTSPNIFRRPDGTYFYQASPEEDEITVVPRIVLADDPAYWTYADANGKLYTPKVSPSVDSGTVTQGESPSYWDKFVAASNRNYSNPILGAPARWEASLSNGTNPIQGARNILDFVPVAGDALQGIDALKDAAMGDYTAAGLGLGMLAVPNLIEKPLKYLGKGIRSVFELTDSQWDEMYNAAIKANDMEEAQRLRDLHFMTKAPDTAIANEGLPIHAYHGTGKQFNEFDTTGKYSTLDEGYYGVGAYFAPNKEIADMYADTERTPIVYDTYLNIKDPLRHVRDENADLYGKPIVDNDGVISVLPDDLVDPDFDMTEFVATKPNQIKKADVITYDDAGNIIPLSQRDNFALGDMRYGLIPFGIGLTGYGLFNNQEALGGRIKRRKR